MRLLEENAFRKAKSVLDGRVYDGLVPETSPLVVASREGPCRLRVVELPLCDPPCGSGEACVADDECDSYPSVVGVGDAEVRGLATGSVVLKEVAPSYQYVSSDLPFEPCAEGDVLSLSYEDVTIENHCVAPLLIERGEPIPVKRDAPVTLAWEPALKPESARVEILLDISHHGGKRADIFCEVDDVGSLEISQSLVSQLIDLGVAGFPSVIVRRVSSVSSGRHPELSFDVVASVQREVDTGVLSCTSDEECPEGMTCDLDTVVCISL